ncbi:MAG: ABC transporter permease [Caldiserica bacterium]|jgi:simple sugar transport system permease protein|nr:ABC transporter permease [Caldisericota bacterium]MDH7562812.1 ABC transporter permease [Caldisericota bacterium]
MSEKMENPNSAALAYPKYKRFTYERVVDFLVPVVCIILGFLVGMILIAIAGKSPIGAYYALFKGAFGSLTNISESLLKAAILIFTGLSVGLAFRCGLFNIGAEGQFMVGAISAAFIGHWVSLPPYLHIPLVFLFAALTSGIWGLIAGWLKVTRGVHEVISTIMLNWIAYYLIQNWLVTGPMAVKTTSTQIVVSEAGTPAIYSSAKLWRFLAEPPNSVGRIALIVIVFLVSFFALFLILKRAKKLGAGTWLFSLLGSLGIAGISGFFIYQWHYGIPGVRLNIGLFLALAAVAFVFWLLYRTVVGYEIRAAGYNPHAARYAGINVNKRILLSMFIAGALAGFGGVLMVLGTEFKFPGVFPGGYGFDGIAMALIGQNHPIGIMLSATLFGFIRGGATAMQLPPYKIHKSFADIIQGSVVLFIAAYYIIKYILMLPARRKE